MKTFILSAVLAAIPGLAVATDCNVQRVVYSQPVVTYVQPVRQVQFVEVVDNHHYAQAQRVQKVRVVQQNNHHNNVQLVRVERVVNRHHNNQQQRNRGFFQRILGR